MTNSGGAVAARCEVDTVEDTQQTAIAIGIAAIARRSLRNNMTLATLFDAIHRTVFGTSDKEIKAVTIVTSLKK
jgi:hypothetical protein